MFKGHKKFYLEGFCYYFAVILRERFSTDYDSQGKKFETAIWYNPVRNHFACSINGYLFDANGRIALDKDWYAWEVYRKMDPLDSSRTLRYCIYK